MDTNEPITEEISKGIKAARDTSASSTSMAKITAPIGALKIAEIAPAAPSADQKGSFFIVEVCQLSYIGAYS